MCVPIYLFSSVALHKLSCASLDVVHAINPNGPPPISPRFVSVCCMTFAFIVHGTRLQWGLRIQNSLATFKLFVLVGMAVSGLAVLAGAKGFRVEHVSGLILPSAAHICLHLKQPPNNFDKDVLWQGSGSGGTNAFVNGLYNVIWSFIGYSNANYALSEVRNPVRTIKLAAPLAMLLVTGVYLLVNVAYYAVVDKESILGSGQIAAALFFGRLWGMEAERVSILFCTTQHIELTSRTCSWSVC